MSPSEAQWRKCMPLWNPKVISVLTGAHFWLIIDDQMYIWDLKWLGKYCTWTLCYLTAWFTLHSYYFDEWQTVQCLLLLQFAVCGCLRILVQCIAMNNVKFLHIILKAGAKNGFLWVVDISHLINTFIVYALKFWLKLDWTSWMLFLRFSLCMDCYCILFLIPNMLCK